MVDLETNLKADIKLNTHIDFPDPQHFTKDQITAQNLGEAVDIAENYVRNNPFSLIDIGLTPGGARLFDISNIARIQSQSPQAIQKHLKFLTDIKTDPAYRNFEQQRMKQGIINAQKMLNSHLDIPSGLGWDISDKEFWQVADDVAGSLPKNMMDPWGASMPKIPIPQSIYDIWRKNENLTSAVRLQAKPGRVEALSKSYQGKPQQPPFTYQHMLTLGSPEHMNPTLMRVVDRHNSLVTNIRKAQGLSDPNRPDLGLGFADSDYLDPILKTVDPAYQALIRKNLQLGLAGPGLMHMALPETEE